LLSTWIISSRDRKQSRRFWCWLYTKYGDGGVDLSPIADLMKSGIYVSCLFKVPDSILNAAPSDGLFGDEKQMKHN
jgi:NAD+ synthase